MRIIAGEFRGRKLLGPASDVTRPVTDRVKQSVFDILTPRLDDARVYDCFAGTGSMGLECLSRGAKHVTFFEADRPALLRLRENIKTIQCGPRTQVVPGDLFKWISSTSPPEKADIIFLDPPYRFLHEKPGELLEWAEHVALKHAAPDALIVFRHDVADTLALPPLNVTDQREYGGMIVEFLRLESTSVHESVVPVLEA